MSDAVESPAPRAGMIGQRVGNYEIISKIGEGGMGAVYLGQHPLIGKKVAIKVLLEELVSNESIATRFFNEAKAANDIRHQNIVDVVDFGKIPKEGGGFVVYIMMEFLEGDSLSARLHKGPMPVAMAQHILVQCCSGLAASHAKGIIHRDLKPDNLFIIQRGSDDNFVKILDFGIAKLTATAAASSQTRTGTIIGTPAYMSPEQCAGRNKIDARSDIYSLGIVMYEMLTGRVPFIGEGFGEIVVAQITETPKAPTEWRPDLPPAWEQIVMRALEKDPDKRFQTMEELGIALADPTAYAASPLAVAQAGYAASAPTTSVPAVTDASGAYPIPRQAGAHARTQAEKAVEPATVMGKREVTTLSGAASEIRGPAPGKARRLALIGVTAAVGVAAAIALVVLKTNRVPAALPPPTPAVVVAPVAPKPPEEVVIKLASNPPGAQIIRSDRDDAPVGVTPLTLRVDRGKPFDVSLKLDGYKVEKRAIDAESNQGLEISLVKEEPVAAPKKERRHAQPDKPEKSDKQDKVDKPAGDDEHKLLPPEL